MILITGATGLVGSHLLAKLVEQDQKIRAIYRTETKKNATLQFLKNHLKVNTEDSLAKIEWFEADILNIPTLTDAFSGIDFVYHCAGLISYDVRDYKKLRKINIEGTANVVNLALAKKVKKLCHVSSVAALGSEIGNKPITEKSARNNEAEHSNYSITKFGAEMEVWRASQEGLNVVILNPGVIIGVGPDASGSAKLFKKVDKGLPYYPKKTTGFVGIEDVVNAMVLLMKSEIENERFIMVAENLKFKTVLDEIAEALQKPKPKRPLKAWMIWLGWLFQSMGNFFLNTKKEITRDAVKGMFETTEYDNSKIKTELDFQFTSIQSAIKKAAISFREL